MAILRKLLVGLIPHLQFSTSRVNYFFHLTLMHRNMKTRAAYTALMLVLTCALLSHDSDALPSLQVQDLELVSFHPPDFYHGLEGPEFKVSNRTDLPDGVEERTYSPAKWASTKVDSILYSKAVTTGFMRLFKYIQGANEGNKTIPMTVPVTVKVVPGEGPFCSNSFTISFYVPEEFASDTPEPTNKDVFIEKTHKETLYVSSFGGYAIDPVVVFKSKALIRSLRDAGKDIDDTYFFTAGYDGPYRVLNRHNEIWIKKLESDGASAKAIH